jgi:hypothetical protein
LSYIIYAANTSNIYHRKYIKISDILASVGGLMQIFYLLFSLINIPFSEISKYEKIIDKIFYFEDTDLSLINNVNDMKSKIIPFERFQNMKKSIKMSHVNLSSNLKLNETKIVNPNKNETNTRIFRLYNIDMNKIMSNVYNRHKKVTFKFSFIDKFKMIIERVCKCKYKTEFKDKIYLFELARHKIRNYFNFINIIVKFEEFEKIKKILLSEEQQHIFKLNRKTKLSLLEKYEKVRGEDHEYTQEEIKELFKDIIFRFKTGTQTNFDEGLVKLF